MNNHLVTTDRFSLVPQTMTEALHFSKLLSESTFVPKDYQRNPGNVLVAMQWGMEIGLSPLQALQNISVINGRPAVWGDAMLALVRGSGLLESLDEVQTDTLATCTIKRKGEAETVRTFGIEDAKKANLWGKAGPWQQYPKRMMQMRARAFALRDVFPDVLKGIHIAEEAQDIPSDQPVSIGAVSSVAEPKTNGKIDTCTPESPASQNQKDEIIRLCKVLGIDNKALGERLWGAWKVKWNDLKSVHARLMILVLSAEVDRLDAVVSPVYDDDFPATDDQRALILSMSGDLGLKPDKVDSELKSRGAFFDGLTHNQAEGYIENLSIRLADKHQEAIDLMASDGLEYEAIAE